MARSCKRPKGVQNTATKERKNLRYVVQQWSGLLRHQAPSVWGCSRNCICNDNSAHRGRFDSIILTRVRGTNRKSHWEPFINRWLMQALCAPSRVACVRTCATAVSVPYTCQHVRVCFFPWLCLFRLFAYSCRTPWSVVFFSLWES